MFYCITKDGQVYKDHLMSNLPQIDSVLCYLHDCYVETYTTENGNTYDWYRFEFIDRLGNPVSFKLGTCEVVFIEKDDGSYYLRQRCFTIRDQYSREGKFVVRGEKGDFAHHHLEKIATKLVPFMLTLSAAGGWDAYWSQKRPDSPESKK